MARPFVKNLAHLPVTPGAANGTMTLENPGDVEAYPIWELRGPGKNFRAISPRGEVLEWLGTLTADETLVIDTQAGTVLDGKGENRYAELGETPRMWTIPPGETTAEIRFEATSSGTYEPGALVRTNWSANPVPVGPALGSNVANFAGYLPGTGETGVTMTSDAPLNTAVVATNYITNPSFEGGAAGWLPSSCTIERGTTTRAGRVGSYVGTLTVASPAGTVYLSSNTHAEFPALFPAGAGRWVGASILAGRSTGAQYARVSIGWYNAAGTVISYSQGPIGALPGTSLTRFIAVAQAPTEAVTARLFFYPVNTATGGVPPDGITFVDAGMLAVASTEADAAAAAADYVDGSSPTVDLPGDVRFVHAWSGAAHGSSSTRALTITPGAKGPDGIPGFARRVVTAPKTGASTGWSSNAAAYRASLAGARGDRVTCSVYLRYTGPTPLRIRLRTQPYEVGGTAAPGLSDTPLTPLPSGEWVRLSSTHEALADFETVGWWAYLIGSTGDQVIPAGGCLDIAGALIEPGGDLRPWFYGAMASGSRGVYAFAGAVNASISHMYSAVLRGASRVAVSWRARKWMVI
ncbi:phage tail domain-containing protein [Cellulosimicrobium sp. TH-20]|uniref:phage tail domain-containing protein n=1 Tax=Cellulosimicrobium sp. TH-20 TaxID=1980001 RepID=UPI0011A1C3F9|nr:phage tail domain-containing protein [Cellulosimicrobium sp. TH-20]